MMFVDSAPAVEVACDRFALRFASDGRPASLRLRGDQQEELLNVRDPGTGFVIVFAGKDFIVPMERVSQPDPDHLLVSTANRSQQVRLRVRRAQRHLGFDIEWLRGFPVTGDLALRLEINAGPQVRGFEHDYMTQVENRAEGVRVAWNHLWQRAQGDPPGGFSLYHWSDPADEDETLLHIWAEQDIAHPHVEGPWTVATARQWLQRWQQRFSDRALWSQFSIMYFEPLQPEDLRIGAQYAQQAGVSALYLMPWSWRGEYWPDYQPTVGVNTKLFPRGEADVKALSDYCAELGLGLELHYVSGGIGFHDPCYVVGGLDPRLASWGQAVLQDRVAAREDELHIRLAEQTQLPFRVPSHYWRHHEYGYPMLYEWFNYDVVQIEDELIKVGRFEHESEDRWRLVDCRRGFADTPVTDHPAGSMMRGLVTAYDQNLLPDNYSSLFTEIAADYAGFLNRCGITQAVFDGIEIHRFFSYGQGEKFTREVYRRLDHPCVTHNSSGHPPACWMEYRFNSTRALLGNGHGAHADIIADHPSRAATTLLDAHFALGQAAARDSRAYGVRSGDRGMTVDTLRRHGLTDEILAVVRAWRAVDAMLTPGQRAAMLATDYPDPLYPLKLAGHHPRTPVVHVAEQDADRCTVTPVRVMTRRQGDIQWRSCQEHGTVGPRQFIRTDQKLRLENPYEEQPVHFIIRVLFNHDYEHAENIPILVAAAAMTHATDTVVAAREGGLALTFDNARATDIWQEQGWPNWPTDGLDLTEHRAMGCWVTGDGSGATLVFNLYRNEYEQRDYVIPLDFTGRRYVEIPHGQVAWANGAWGWRMATWKFFDYAQVRRVRLGYGYVPPATRAQAVVEGIKALQEIPAVLHNPVVHTEAGTLRVRGDVHSEQYLRFDGGAVASVYDKNWNLVQRCPVEVDGFNMPRGWGSVWVTSDTPSARVPWLETQFMVRDKPLVAAKRNNAQRPSSVARQAP